MTCRILMLGLLLIAAWDACGAQAQTSRPSSEPAAGVVVRREVLIRWGEETLAGVEQRFRTADGALYVEQLQADRRERGRAPRPSFLWPAGVQLSALAAAASVDRARYAPRLKDYASSVLDRYRNGQPLSAGLSVLPNLKAPDRYYDDNAWIVLGLVETWEDTGEARFLTAARQLQQFVLSGESPAPDGGLWWRENEKTTRNTCSNAPAIVGCLRLGAIDHDHALLATAKRLYAWTNAHLQDPADGLYWDHVNAKGAIDRTKWSYNTALMIRANLLLNRASGDQKYLDEAHRLAAAAVGHWIDRDSGALHDEAPFAHLLVDALLDLSDQDHDARWRVAAERAILFLHDRARDASGYYGRRWDAPPRPGESPRLIDQASAARAFFGAASASRAQPR